MPYTDLTLKMLADEVEKLIDSGIRINDIAILVRKNKTIPAIADFFDKNTPYRVVSDEAFRLDASLAVCMLVDGLRFISQPDDRIACARLAVAFQKEILKKDIDINTVLLNEVEEYLPAEFRLMMSELRLMPLYELLEKMFIIFDMENIKEQDAYLCAFFDSVTEYMQNNSSQLTAFIKYWEETLCSKTIPSGEISGIRILSIHKSKGLEYHTVLLPFCDWKMENETNNHLLWCRINDSGSQFEPFNELDLTPVNYSSSMAESLFSDSYQEEKLQLWVDNLNLLYVAFTRACKNLIVWCKNGQKGTVSELMQSAISEINNIQLRCNVSDCEEDYPDYSENTDSTQKRKGKKKEDVEKEEEEIDDKEETPIYEFGEICSSEEDKKSESSNRLVANPVSVPIYLESLETDIEFKQSNRSADFIRGDEDEEENTRSNYIKQGQLLHTLFASIHKTEDIDNAIEELCFEGIIESAEQEKRIKALAMKALSKEEVKDWYNGTWTLYNECAIIYKNENNEMQTRRPDRVMMKNGEVVVVDFKFGRKKAEYISQVKEYMNLLEDMGYQNIKGYIWYVFSGELQSVNI